MNVLTINKYEVIGFIITAAIIICALQIIRLLFVGARRIRFGRGKVGDKDFKEDMFNNKGLGTKTVKLIIIIIIFVYIALYFNIPLFFTGDAYYVSDSSFIHESNEDNLIYFYWKKIY